VSGRPTGMPKPWFRAPASLQARGETPEAVVERVLLVARALGLEVSRTEGRPNPLRLEPKLYVGGLS
jgi:hypothetical protein